MKIQNNPNPTPNKPQAPKQDAPKPDAPKPDQVDLNGGKDPQPEGPSRWQKFGRGALMGGLTYGLPAAAGAACPDPTGAFVGGLVLGAGMGVCEARNSDGAGKIRSAMGGMIVGMCSANVARHFGWAGAAAVAGLGALSVGFYYSRS